jgi:2-dehydropantoate 2-reductase
MLDPKTPITIAGAGSIGCHAGGCLALAGRKVTLLTRPHLAEKITTHGLKIIDLGGSQRSLRPGAIEVTSDPARALARAGVVIVTVKCNQTSEMADIVAACAPSDAIVVSLQNGVDNPTIIRSRLRSRQSVVPGMVPFNVVQAAPDDGQPSFHRTTGGDIQIEAGDLGLADLLDVPGLPVQPATDMPAVLWGKLILNLNNALNALSGLPLVEQLADRRWRLLLAAQMSEALAAMKAAGIAPARIGRLKPSLLPFVLRLPDSLFRLLARQMLAVDPAARSSMWEDLQQHRRTEIGQFQGAVVRLAAAKGRQAPVSQAIMELVLDAEERGKGSPRLSPDAIKL